MRGLGMLAIVVTLVCLGGCSSWTPAADVTITSCGSPPPNHRPTASLKVTNSSSDPKYYAIPVNFLDSQGQQIGTKLEIIYTLNGGKTAAPKAILARRESVATCELGDVSGGPP
jgi:hypothetical protein